MKGRLQREKKERDGKVKKKFNDTDIVQTKNRRRIVTASTVHAAPGGPSREVRKSPEAS